MAKPMSRITPVDAIGKHAINILDHGTQILSHCGGRVSDDDIIEPILDLRWIASGSLDNFPLLVTFSEKLAVVHRV